MRESNFAFPAQNKACVCITSQLYDRRALDTSSPLPLFNSLTHLTYLTSTSPRLYAFFTTFAWLLPPPQSPAAFYGLLPSTYRAPRGTPQLNPPAGQFDKHAAYRFSLAFQCVVNIGVRGSEPIRSRVVQAGTLDVVGCILEAWLAGRGFAVGPSTSATGLPRETRQSKAARRAAAAARGRPDQNPETIPGPERLLAIDTYIPATDDVESATTPIMRDRSATVVRRAPNPDEIYAAIAQPQPAPPSPSLSVISSTSTGARTRSRASSVASPITISRASPVSSAVSSSRASPSPSTRTDTDTDGDGDVEMVAAGVAGLGVAATTTAAIGDSSTSASPSPPPLNRVTQPGDQAPAAAMNMNMNLNMMTAMMGMEGMTMMGLTRDPRIAGVEDGMGIQGMGIGGEEGMEGDATNLMLNMGMMNPDVGMLGLDGMAMMGMNLNMGMNMGGPLTMIGGMTMADVSGSGAESEARADTDADAEESDAGTSNIHLGRRRGDDETQTQTPRAGLARLPSASPEAGPSGTSTSTLNDEDEEEGQVVAAIRGSASNSGTMRRTGTVRATSVRSVFAEASSPARSRDRADTARQPAVSPTSNSGPSRTHQATAAANASRPQPNPATAGRNRQTVPAIPAIPPLPAPRAREREDRHHHNHAHPTGPYRDEDVLLSLQLLAYLSKYPHVRQAFYKKRNGFHPASPLAVMAAKAQADAAATEAPKPPEMVASSSSSNKTQTVKGRAGAAQGSQQLAFLRALGVSSATVGAKDKEKGKGKVANKPAVQTAPVPTATTTVPNPATTRPGYETNVFSLVERFTFRPSSSETSLPNPPPRLPPEIQYWAGVIMRNACRKDDSRGGIRQCANMLCGRWEEYPREFAKCRRCRKAKYCGKECQSTAWSEGHRFWCSAKEGDDPAPETSIASTSNVVPVSVTIQPPAAAAGGVDTQDRRDRRERRERDGRLVSPPPSSPETATVREFPIPIQVAAGAVIGGAPVTINNATAGPSRETQTHAAGRRPVIPGRQTTHPLGPIGSPAPTRRQRDAREGERDMTNSFATFDTYLAERQRHETAMATGQGQQISMLHHPQPQNPANSHISVLTTGGFSGTSRRRAAEPGSSGSRGDGSAEDMVE
ncbi:DNA helicase [Mycena indigotica]|uniref:DNA helicase n=1 Tax=Mycena indigotica TaxID=2126181 RepID=A0A8H6VS25_9AGAR|nr:DNA helicase [Mycena indigotica]KAF7291902.1 DNA helicase [Mycena indigotica]